MTRCARVLLSSCLIVVCLAWPSMADAQRNRRVILALDAKTTFDFVETPLQDAIDVIKDLHKIEVQIDEKALKSAGIAKDAPLSKNLKGISLRSALSLLLRDHDLTYVAANEVLMITTPQAAADLGPWTAYDVKDLIGPSGDASSLAQTVIAALRGGHSPPQQAAGPAPDDYRAAGDISTPAGSSEPLASARVSGAHVLAYRNVLLVRGSLERNFEVEQLLNEFRSPSRSVAEAAPALLDARQQASTNAPRRRKTAVPTPIGSPTTTGTNEPGVRQEPQPKASQSSGSADADPFSE